MSSVEADSALQLVLQFDDNDTPSDVVDALVLSAFVTGTQPWARSTRLDRIRDDATLLPPGARLLRSAAIKNAAEPEPEDDSVAMGFWYHSPRRGVVRISRSISAGTWADIRGNYPSAVASVLDELMEVSPDGINGRLLLLHGPPGTGKTTALRALARQWRDWCQVDCVLDPERLFNDPSYLMDVAIGDDGGEGRWRLLVLEDCADSGLGLRPRPA